MNSIVYGALIAALLVGGGTGAYFIVRAGAHEAVPVDGDLCRTDRPLAAHRVAVIDTSDRLSDEEQRLARGVLDRDAAAAAAYEKLTVMAMHAATPFAPERLFSACAPKKAADAQGLSENPALYRALWTHRFHDPLDQAIKREMADGPEDRSPIIETIWAISRLHDFGSDVPNRRLDLVSDMLQNTRDYSQYRSRLSFKSYLHTQFGRLHMPDLRGVTVVIHYLARPETLRLQGKRHLQFWVEFFNAAGAKNVMIEGAPENS